MVRGTNGTHGPMQGQDTLPDFSRIKEIQMKRFLKKDYKCTLFYDLRQRQSRTEHQVQTKLVSKMELSNLKYQSLRNIYKLSWLEKVQMSTTLQAQFQSFIIYD